ncbi:MAG: hypothetical protein JWP03_1300 [Phycisphaerales bacterium]|nr:hypothetical protein [Phycisphaerales bacterium]
MIVTLFGNLAIGAPVPAPAEQVAEVVVSGRTSTLVRVDVAAVGDVVPDTLAGERPNNTPGFSWYVSRHYAMKTDGGQATARSLLELLEMVYPHYVHLFGGEPAGIETKRMAVVYGSKKHALDKAMKSDGITWDFDGGGITYERRKVSYAYPSGSLTYHQRYIIIHECTHLFQMCLTGACDNTPPWFFEGIADGISSHVYDEARRRITLDVLDKATPNNYLDSGLEELAKHPMTVRAIDRSANVSRGVGFLLANFLRSTPDREQRFRIWRDFIFREPQRTHDQPAVREAREALLGELFGGWDALEADFAAWCKARRATFHYVEWGYEQDRDTLCSYGFAEHGKLSQTDVRLPPGEKAAADPWRLDYAGEPMPETVGPVARGGDEPAIGALLDFRNEPGVGLAGIGLGVKGAGKDSGFLKVLVREGRQLEIDGSDMGGPVTTQLIADDVCKEMAADRGRIGMTVTIGRDILKVTLRAKPLLAVASPECTETYEISEPQRKRLLEMPLTILARGGYHRVTPFFDEGLRAGADPSAPAPPGRWRNPGDKQLESLYRTWHALGPDVPQSVERLRIRMLKAADASPAAQREAVRAFNAAAAELIADVQLCGANADAIAVAVEALRGANVARLGLRPNE